VSPDVRDPRLLAILAGCTARANPSWEFTVAGAADPAGEGPASGDLAAGYLVSKDEGWPVTKRLNAATAALFQRFQKPAPLKGELNGNHAGARVGEIVRLVLDDVLQIDVGARFAGGAAACGALGIRPSDLAYPSRGSGALSLNAIRYGSELTGVDPDLLAARLYFYHRLPVTPQWRQRLRDARAAAEFMGVGPGSSLTRRLARRWIVPEGVVDSADWMHWTPRFTTATPSTDGFVRKLYLAVMPAALPELLPSVVEVMERHDAPPFKFGAGVYGLMRPDKFVVYFTSHATLTAFADDLRLAVRGAPAHGVPFTAPLDDAAILSWGVDPPRTSAGSVGEESWRVLVSGRIASALFSWRRVPDETVPAVEFVLTRLAFDGIDVATWAPQALLFDELS
jgi:hypothetical protein